MDIMTQDDKFTCEVRFILPSPDPSQIFVIVRNQAPKDRSQFYFLDSKETGGMICIPDKISDPFHVQHQKPYCSLRRFQSQEQDHQQ